MCFGGRKAQVEVERRACMRAYSYPDLGQPKSSIVIIIMLVLVRFLQAMLAHCSCGPAAGTACTLLGSWESACSPFPSLRPFCPGISNNGDFQSLYITQSKHVFMKCFSKFDWEYCFPPGGGGRRWWLVVNKLFWVWLIVGPPLPSGPSFYVVVSICLI